MGCDDERGPNAKAPKRRAVQTGPCIAGAERRSKARRCRRFGPCAVGVIQPVAIRKGGFSLIELLLALGLASVIGASVAGLYSANGRTNAVAAGQARLQESARYALDFIARSARAAGYVGCGAAPSTVRNTLRGAWGEMFEVNVSAPVEAFDGRGNGGVNGWAPSLTSLPRRGSGGAVNAHRGANAINVSALTPGADVLVLRYVAGGAPLAAPAGPADAPVVAGDGAFDAGDFAVIADCEKAALFRVSAAQASATGDQRLARAGGAGAFNNAVGVALAEPGAVYGGPTHPAGAAVGHVVTDIYFVAPGRGVNNRGVRPGALWRKRSTERPAELVEGIETLQVLVGVDADGDGAVDRYANPGTAAGMPVRAIRFAVTATSVDAVDGNALLRRTFSRTVALRN